MLSPELFLSQLKSPNLRRGVRYGNKILADFNRSCPCAICGAPPPSQNSHSLKKGRSGNSGSQVWGLPLCDSCHKFYESVSIEKYLEKYPNFFEIVTRHIERAFDYFTGNENSPAPKQKPAQKKTVNPIFKNVKGTDLQKCKTCLFKSFPSDEVRHRIQCVHAGSETS